METISIAGKKNGIYIKQDDISVLFCLTGNADIHINDKIYKLQNSHGIVIFQGVYFCLGDKSEDFTSIEVTLPYLVREHISINNIASDLALLATRPMFYLDRAEQENFTRIAELYNNMQYMHGKYCEKCIINICLSLVYFICEASAKEGCTVLQKESLDKKERQYYHFSNFLTLLQQHCREERNIGFYADKLCITPKYLSAAVKCASGKTAGHWIEEFVISEAKQHLKHPGKNIQEISDLLNFSSQSFFGKYFKRLTGISPVKYKHMAGIA
ncbi:MAG: helix-turn-helix domain-containing protein [Rikenellaceae bacterium]|nr:helix-turn-helix domain-containing protein [Rikenellaceae bacterium]